MLCGHVSVDLVLQLVRVASVSRGLGSARFCVWVRDLHAGVSGN